MTAAGAKSGRSRLASSAAAFAPATSVSKLAIALAVSSDGAAARRVLLVDLARRLAGVEQLERPVPVAARGLLFQRRIRRPGELRRDVGGAAGIVPGRGAVAEALGFEIEAAQAEKPHFRLVQHGLELLTGSLMVTLEQRGLRVEKLDERLLVRSG